MRRRRTEYNTQNKTSNKIKAIFPWLIIIAIVFYSVGGEYDYSFDDSGIDISHKEPYSWDEENVSMQIHRKINDERSLRGYNELEYSSALEEVADYHSKEMAENNFFSHDSPSGETMNDRYDAFGLSCRLSAENIHQTYWKESVQGYGLINTREDVAENVVNGWMNSPGHRENILLEGVESQGIGIFKTEDGEVFVTQNFCG